MKETLKQIIERIGDSALQQHIPLTAEMIADEIIKSGLVQCAEKPFDCYKLVHISDVCGDPEKRSEIVNRFDQLEDAISFALMLKEWPAIKKVELYGVCEERHPVICWTQEG